MLKDKSPSRIPINPSSKDPIVSWLDVMSNMLELPDTQRKQVRDELEDHLRSRVDDLIIMGNTEHQAIKIAVSELGETAEIAKLISNAHSIPTRRRTIMNTLAIAAAITGMSFGWISLTQSTEQIQSNTVAENAQANSTFAIEVTEADFKASDPNATHVFEYESHISMYTMLKDIAKAFGKELEISQAIIGSSIDAYLGSSHASIEGEMTFEQAIAHFNDIFDPALIGTEILVGDRVIELITHGEYLRRSTSIEHYSIEWSSFEHAQNIYHTLENIVGKGRHSTHFNMSVVGDQVIVDALPKAHEQVIEILAVSKDSYLRVMEEEKRRKAESLFKIRSEFERVEKDLIKMSEIIRTNKLEITEIQFSSDSSRTKLSRLRTELLEAEFEHEELRARQSYLRDRLIESDYAQLILDLD